VVLAPVAGVLLATQTQPLAGADGAGASVEAHERRAVGLLAVGAREADGAQALGLLAVADAAGARLARIAAAARLLVQRLGAQRRLLGFEGGQVGGLLGLVAGRPTARTSALRSQAEDTERISATLSAVTCDA
jgi:hypothetical protein